MKETTFMSDPAPYEEPTKRPWRGAIGELEDLQTEIDDDLTAGRISPEVYWSANERIGEALKAATAPVPADNGRRIRAVGIPAKEIDVEQLAQAYWLMGKRLAREKREVRAPRENRQN
jgi:hypothetical protein